MKQWDQTPIWGFLKIVTQKMDGLLLQMIYIILFILDYLGVPPF